MHTGMLKEFSSWSRRGRSDFNSYRIVKYTYNVVFDISYCCYFMQKTFRNKKKTIQLENTQSTVSSDTRVTGPHFMYVIVT
jgi:hypothetical protein